MEEKRIALIPAYEPEKILLEVVDGLKKNGFDIVVVNDGSDVRSNDIFKSLQEDAKVLKHTWNRGKGSAIKTGLKYILNHFRKPYVVVTVDADGQHRAEDAKRVCEEAFHYRSSLILGSRKFDGKVPIRSRIGNTITRYVYRITSGERVYDTQTGLRAFSDVLVEELLSIPGERYEYEMNMLMQFAREKKEIREVWIETVYTDGNASSHFDTLKDSARIYKEILKFSGASFIGFLVDYLLYCILISATGGIVFSNVAARMVSATINYTLNRKLVFQSKVPFVKSVLQYAVLAVVLLCCNTVVLKLLTDLGVNRYLGKICTELAMFMASWFVQHRVIFAGRRTDKESNKERHFFLHTQHGT